MMRSSLRNSKCAQMSFVSRLLLGALSVSWIATSPLTAAAKTAEVIPLTGQMPAHLNEMTLEMLSQDRSWRRLLLIRDGDAEGSRTKDLRFFVSRERTPKAELFATYQAIYEQDQAVLCRFPARVNWLSQRLGIAVDLSKCHELTTWLEKHRARRLALVFAEEHPNHLGSAFAHVLIKADRGQEGDAFAINYTVSRDQGDAQAASGVRSLVGGYDGLMEVLDYATKRDGYLVDHRRDLWEYPLDLNADEIDQILRHVWEVKDLSRPYFFTHENCATEILRFIDLVRPASTLQQQAGKITIPSEIVRIMDSNGIITSEHYLPSIDSVAQAQLNAKASTALVDQRPVGDAVQAAVAGNPRHSAPTHKASIGIGQYDTHPKQSYVTAGIAGAYHDVLDRPVGVRQYLDLSLMDVSLRIDSDGRSGQGDLGKRVYVERFDIFGSRSYNPINTAKAYDGKMKGLQLGWRQVLDASDRQNAYRGVLHAGIERGRSWTLGMGAPGTGRLSDTLCYVYAGAVGELGRVKHGYRVGVSANAGCIHHFAERARLQADLSVPFWHHGAHRFGRTHYVAPSVKLGMQYDLSSRDALRIAVSAVRGYDDTIRDVRVAYQRTF